jgi:hypothetical protein
MRTVLKEGECLEMVDGVNFCRQHLTATSPINFFNNNASPSQDADLSSCLKHRDVHRLRLAPSAIRLVLHDCMINSATCTAGPP